MTKVISILAMVLFSIPCFANESRAIAAANSWLDVVDSGNYIESWSQTAPFFQSQVTIDQWVQALDSARSPLGKPLSRRVRSANKHTSLPGAPDGEYVVITLDAEFENNASTVETVTVTKSSGEWRMIGYFIK